MKIVGIMAARNEDWCLGLTARAALMWLDSLVILDHASTDNTAEIVEQVGEEHPERVAYDFEPDPVWKEMEHRQRMLDTARRLGATHICYIDADEIITGDLLGSENGHGPRIRGLFASVASNTLLQLTWLAMRGSIGQFHTTGPWADNQVASFGFMDDPALHWSSAKRGGYDFHHRQPMGKALVPWNPIHGRNSGLLHLQFVSGRRLRAKQYLYQLTERLRWPNREPVEVVRERYSLAVYGQKTPCYPVVGALGPAPMDDWWGPYKHLMEHFHPQEKPWQMAECERIRRENPGIEKGLDDFGLFTHDGFRRG